MNDNRNNVVVILLRRDPDSLSEAEIQNIEKALPGKNIMYVRTDPVDYKQHADQCRELKPVAVLLPMEKPIPSQAMEEGFQHVILTPGGVKELKPLVPQFTEFKQKTNVKE